MPIRSAPEDPPAPRRPSAPTRLSPQAPVLLGLVALPAGLLTLAKLFDSAVLGWMFGVTLMLGVALLPVVAAVFVGCRVLRWMVRRLRGAARPVAVSAPAAGPMPAVQVERDTVHASDEAPSQRVALPAGCTLREAVARALAQDPLPCISGGRATWVVEWSGGAGFDAGPVAVCAQQWTAPVFGVDPDQPAAGPFGGASARLRFRYRCQDDPDRVFDALFRTARRRR